MGGLVTGVLLGLGMHAKDLVSDTSKSVVPILSYIAIAVFFCGGLAYTLFFAEV